MDPINPIAGNPEALSPIEPRVQERPSTRLNNITIFSMALFVLLSLGVVAFLYYQNQQLKGMLAKYQTPTPSSMPIVSPTPIATTSASLNQSLSFSDGNSLEFQPNSYPDFSLKRLTVDSYSMSSQNPGDLGIKISSYKLLPDSIAKDSGTDSDGNLAATGCHFDSNLTTVNGYSFNRQICYYNPISETSSSKYDPKISSPQSISCIYAYPNNKGFVVFGQLLTAASTYDVCEFVKGLNSLKFK